MNFLFFFFLFRDIPVSASVNKTRRIRNIGSRASINTHTTSPAQENMKVLSKSSRGILPSLVHHDRIPRQIHLSRATRIPQTSRSSGGWRVHTEVGALRFEQSSPITEGENGRRGVDFRASGGGAFPPPKGLRPSEEAAQPPRASKGTPRLSTNRLRPLATPGQAMPRLGVFGRRRTRSNATRPGRPG